MVTIHGLSSFWYLSYRRLVMGLFVLFLVLFIAALIGLIICIIRLIRSQSRLLSKREMNKEAHKRALDLKYKDPVITCDYCGRKINTKKEKVCPGCGASYGTDEEWKARHNVSDEFVKKHAEAISKDMEKRSRIEGKFGLIWLLGMSVAMVTFFCLMVHFGYDALFLPAVRSDEILNESTFEYYTKADYTVDGDGVLYEDDRIAIKVSGIYHGTYEVDNEIFGKEGHIKIGFTITNKTKEKAVISFDCRTVNGVEESGYYFSCWGAFKKHSDTTIYETLYYVPYRDISSICFENIDVYFEHNRKIEVLNSFVELKTTLTDERIPDFRRCSLLYTNDIVDVYEYQKENSYYESIDVFVINKTGLDIKIECDGVRSCGKDVAFPYDFYDTYIRSGEIFRFSRSRAFNAYYGDLAGKDMEVSFTFKFPDDPSKNQSTGYFDL